MTRLIDADKLPEHKFTRESAKASDYMRGWNDAIDTIVDNAPTVNIQTAVMELYRRYQPRLATNVYEFGVELQELLGRYGGGKE